MPLVFQENINLVDKTGAIIYLFSKALWASFMGMRAQRIQSQINAHFKNIQKLEIVDESHQHAGRAGQESHFKVLVVSDDFEGMTRVQRQRQMNELLKAEFETGLHALTMRLLSGQEFQQGEQNFQSPQCQGSKG